MNCKKLILFSTIFCVLCFIFITFVYSLEPIYNKQNINSNQVSFSKININVNNTDNKIVNSNSKKSLITKNKILSKKYLEQNLFGLLNKKPKLKDDYLLLDQTKSSILFPPENVVSREHYISLLKSSPQRNINNSNSTVPNFTSTCPANGQIHIPVLLVDFVDQQHVLESNLFEDMFNSSNYLPNQDITGISVSEYYNRQSYGELDFVFDVYDWQTLNINSYEYYKNDASSQFELIVDIIHLFDDIIDYTNYDFDNDNRIDGFIIIAAGLNSSVGILPQTRILKAYSDTVVDDMNIGNVALVSELLSQNNCNAAVSYYDFPTDCRVATSYITQQVGYVLGLPDLHEINPTGLIVGDGIGALSMLTWNLYPQKPINLDPWSRFYLGWLDGTFIGTFGPSMQNQENLCNNKVQTLRSIDQYSDLLVVSNYDSNHMNDKEFFLVENRYVDIDDPNNLDVGNNIDIILNSAFEHLGVAIYHIDEQYISDNFLDNTVAYDLDGDYYDDVISHPGIVFERNMPTIYNDPLFAPGDFYINYIAYDPESPDYLEYMYFNKNEYVLPSIGLLEDNISNSYNGTQNTRLAMEILSAGNLSMDVKVEWQACYGEPNCSIQVIDYCSSILE